MRGERAGAVTGGAPTPVSLGQDEALACRGAGKPEPVGLDPIVTIPRPPLPPVILPLPDAEGLTCLGGDGDGNIIQLLIDLVTGTQPAPPQLPPTHI